MLARDIYENNKKMLIFNYVRITLPAISTGSETYERKRIVIIHKKFKCADDIYIYIHMYIYTYIYLYMYIYKYSQQQCTVKSQVIQSNVLNTFKEHSNCVVSGSWKLTGAKCMILAGSTDKSIEYLEFRSEAPKRITIG